MKIDFAKTRAPSMGPARRGGTNAESGHLLLILMVGLTVMAILLTTVAQQWSTLERRENEKELMFRGNQYVKAIKKYQLEHGGAYPTTLESLIEPGPRRLRYIRKLFRDPMAPDGKWGILLADPSGKGFINPNAPPPADGTVEGLEDLGTGLSSSFDDKLKISNLRNEGRKKVFAAKNNNSSWLDSKDDDKEDDKDKVSVTAPGQPTGPIVGVVSLWDQMSFKRYHEHENYAEWTFSIFDLANQNQQQAQPGVNPGGNRNWGVGPGGSQIICTPDGKCTGGGGPAGGASPTTTPGGGN